MAIEWDGFLSDVSTGNVAGTFYYFDTEAQVIVIRDTDDTLVSKYDTVDLGQWDASVFDNALRVGNFGLNQFVPRHNYNGEIWAVGITPVDVPAGTGAYPTPAVPAGFYIYRYKYYQDLTPILDSFDTSEQSENQIKDAGFVIKNVGEEEFNKTSSIYAAGSKITCKIGMGDSSKMYLGTVFLDEVSWNKTEETMDLNGRNAIGYYLAEQTFDESISFAGTRASVVHDILAYSGIDLKKVNIQQDLTVSSPTFSPTDSLFDGLNRIFDIWGWKMTELPDGIIIIGDKAFHDTFYTVAIHQFTTNEAFARGITQRADGAYSRLALTSSISQQEGPPIVPAFTRTVYKDLSYFDGWSIGNRRTLYLNLLADQSQAAMEALAEEYAKAYQYIGVNITREIPIHPEIQCGDVFEITDAEENEYVRQGIITEVKHKLDIKNGTARTVVSINSGGTITNGATISTYTAYDVTGDTRKRELLDVIRKAAIDQAKKEKEKAK